MSSITPIPKKSFLPNLFLPFITLYINIYIYIKYISSEKLTRSRERKKEKVSSDEKKREKLKRKKVSKKEP